MNCICGSSTFKTISENVFDDRYGYPDKFELLKCVNCSHIILNIEKNQINFDSLYGKYYPRKNLTSIDVKNGSRKIAGLKNKIKLYLEGLSNQGQIYAQRGMKVLDFGCGAGYSLVEMSEIGVDCYGIEADTNVKIIAKELGLKLHVGTLEDSPFKNIKFDLIILNQVLEHVPDPIHLIDKFKSMLSENGIIVISVPNVDSIYRKIFKFKWINWHIPYHIHHFNKETVSELFKRNGYKIIKVKTVTPNLWTSLQIQSLRYEPKLGKSNYMWTGVGVQDYRKMSKLETLLHDFESKSSSGFAKYLMIIFNRIVDLLGYGDSLVIKVKIGK